MKILLAILPLLIAVSRPAAAQTVNGPGDDVLCSTYTPPVLWDVSKLRAIQNPRPPQPLPRRIAITGKPYSTRRVSQDLQIRVDGTRICSVPSINVDYRDSAGRVRLESNFAIAGPDGKPSPAMVRIIDPAAELEYDLDMVSEVAWRFHPPELVMPPANERSVPEPPNPSFSEKKESLGTHSFQGIDVDGTRRTTTGTRPGSSASLTITSEIWIWPYVNTAILNKSVSPAGSRTDAWLKLNTAEPDPALFRVPDGWKIIDGQAAPVTVSAGTHRVATGFQYEVTIAPSQHSEYVIREAPYSAEQTVENSSSLYTPSLIFNDAPVKRYRDSSGRTRVDRPQRALEGDKEPGPVFPRIEDPVDEIEIVLDTVHHVAHRFPLPRPDTNPPSWTMPPGNHPHGVETTKELGEQTMEGLKVTGTLQTFRTPAGANNNDRELVETTESWYSRQLRMIVLGKTNSVTQNSVMRLTHISTEEPDIKLFEIPDGYTVVDEKGPITVVVTQQ